MTWFYFKKKILTNWNFENYCKTPKRPTVLIKRSLVYKLNIVKECSESKSQKEVLPGRTIRTTGKYETHITIGF
jgi:hypothetical protein